MAPAGITRRAVALLADWLIILAFGALAGLTVTAVAPPVGDLDRWMRYASVTAGFTLPVVLAAAVLEARWGRTPGKALLGLTVYGATGPGLGFPRALSRNLVKFAPWEIAHIGIWIVPGRPFVDPPETPSLVLWMAAMSIMAAQGVLVLVTHRAVHDRLIGGRVARRSPAP
ncbi:hypothetical protein DDZ18_01760 [Marinicauda salina]|uniref:RDD domain-containing protein n=1 Tax=Marinicauda salina TaxID=2135793 RepID=A0A2U2BWI1_9PROT|nr:RDD family protein [Marinicauda salina]PWE18357.1 hypothetical protein DDZ18_01760 [Marinicauda salina]